MSSATIWGKGHITIPRAVREKAHLEEGDIVEFEVREEGILMRPKKMVDATQAWYWTDAWQEGERQADDDILAGRTQSFEAEDFTDVLKERSK